MKNSFRYAQLFAAALACGTAGLAIAAGGPPMVTDDPETPGDGRWEINVAVIADKTRLHREATLPDVDVNYGLGDRIQLKLDLPWLLVRDEGQPAKSGLGEANFGVKWRFYDDETSSTSISTYPQYSKSPLASSVRRGIASAGHQLYLPFELSTEFGGVGVVAELGKSFNSGAPNAWSGGIVLTRGCGEGQECMAELHQTSFQSGGQTLVNFGLNRKLDESASLIMAVGREFGGAADDRRQYLVYAGIQLRR